MTDEVPRDSNVPAASTSLPAGSPRAARRWLWVAGLLVLVAPVVLMISLFRKSPQAPAPEIAPGGRASPRGTPGSEPTASYTDQERRELLTLARRALTQVVTQGTLPPVPAEFGAHLREVRGCFVTLEVAGQLRGCIGHIFPREPLAQAVIDNARNAALRDTRFSPVTPAELDSIEIEVSVLTKPQPLAFAGPDDLLQRLRPQVDGVVLEIHGHRSTFLPQVWEKLPDPVVFLRHLASKGGSMPDAWRGPSVKVETYQAEAFTEAELGLR